MFGSGNLSDGVTVNDIPGWNEPDIDQCREAIAGTSECRNRCEPYQVRECIDTLHSDGKCIDECPTCGQEQLEHEEDLRTEAKDEANFQIRRMKENLR